MPRPIHAEIHLAALRHNLHVARQHASGAKVWAVVKANAYGHGLLGCRTAFEEADGLALVEFDQAERLRQAGYRGRLMMIEGAFDAHDLRLAFERQLSLVIHHEEQLLQLESFWRALALQGHAPGRLDLLLKFNSGMNRLGFGHAGFRAARERLRRLPATASLTLMTHFADADVPGGADEALLRFQSACEGFDEARSLANSAATLCLPQTHAQWVRPGIMLYGATPFAPDDATRSAAALGLRPAMHLCSELIAVQHLAPGDAVGYGSTYRASRAMRIGVVACGYADGYPRHAPSGTPVMVAGRRARTVGRVAMDMLMVDLQGIDEAGPGSPVQLWGDALSIDEVAAHAGTIGYELMCALAPRVPQRHIS